ncbi:D-alanyl-D-alanine carboxypeptidase [Halalkalibacillus sediminis]|uniref:D-alanyl-D-alanine carboxypeptidase n=1 Tax=Halalkalibacillus sediminis TaxID=2018042 RepID=A0A2I0QX21_9BACI|nr:D-alanyl-D-alanine carboxypeptidase family protein [Halalkalibacillus sediminis]PKR78891.1 D-alanyl-D-alanine carboxypeptidase [Halalkalibacillus sediminis]
MIRWLVILSVLILMIPPMQVSADIGVSARNAIVMDMNTKEILYEKNANESREIASITKILTAIVAIEQSELDDRVTISPYASRMAGSSIYTKAGQVYTLEDLVNGLLLRSGNDAAVAIAEHVAGSEKGFAYLMNEKARWIGMDNSSFQNPHGLDEEGHYSTAYDMALLTTYAMNSNEQFKEIFGRKQYRSENIDYSWFNKNKLLQSYSDFCTGGKTGYTGQAGRTLVSTASHNGDDIVVVTLQAPDDWNDHRQLYKYAFEKLDSDENDENRDEILNFPSFFDSYRDVWKQLNGVMKWSI